MENEEKILLSKKAEERGQYTHPDFELLILDGRFLSGERRTPGWSLRWERGFPSFAKEHG